MTEAENKSIIPPEWQGYCDIYLSKLGARLSEQTAKKGSGALQRAINYFSSNPEALLREVQTQFQLRPSYFGEEDEIVSASLPSSEPVTKSEGSKLPKMGPEEEAILDEIETTFSKQEVIDALKRGLPLRGSKS